VSGQGCITLGHEYALRWPTPELRPVHPQDTRYQHLEGMEAGQGGGAPALELQKALAGAPGGGGSRGGGGGERGGDVGGDAAAAGSGADAAASRAGSKVLGSSERLLGGVESCAGFAAPAHVACLGGALAECMACA
jgi:hypothetical protein